MKMKIKSTNIGKLVILSSVTIAITGCASLRNPTLKAPCGPLAGMTNPCGERIPINTDKEIESIFADDFIASETI